MRNPGQKGKPSSHPLSKSEEKTIRRILMYFGIFLAVMVVVIVAFCSCSSVNQKLGLKDDNFAEEMAEAAIQMKTGLDVDLTPSSPES